MDPSTTSPSVVTPESSSPLTTTSVPGSRGYSEAAAREERCDQVEAVRARAPRWSDRGRNQQQPTTTTRRCVDTRDSDFTTVGDAARGVLDAMEKGTWIGDQSGRDPARCVDESPLKEDPG